MGKEIFGTVEHISKETPQGAYAPDLICVLKSYRDQSLHKLVFPPLITAMFGLDHLKIGDRIFFCEDNQSYTAPCFFIQITLGTGHIDEPEATLQTVFTIAQAHLSSNPFDPIKK